MIFIEGVVAEKDTRMTMDTTYEKTDLGKRLFVSHFTTLFHLYHVRVENIMMLLMCMRALDLRSILVKVIRKSRPPRCDG